MLQDRFSPGVLSWRQGDGGGFNVILTWGKPVERGGRDVYARFAYCNTFCNAGSDFSVGFWLC